MVNDSKKNKGLLRNSQLHNYMKVYYDMAYALAESFGLIEAENPAQYTKGMQRTFVDFERMDRQKDKGENTSEYDNRPFKSGKRERARSSPDIPQLTQLQKRLKKARKPGLSK